MVPRYGFTDRWRCVLKLAQDLCHQLITAFGPCSHKTPQWLHRIDYRTQKPMKQKLAPVSAIVYYKLFIMLKSNNLGLFMTGHGSKAYISYMEP